MIIKKEVKHIAKLARLGLTEKELKKHQKEFSKIFDYIEKLKEVDVSKVQFFFHLLSENENVMREDKESAKCKAQSAKLLKLMPETKNGYLKTKPIL